MLNGDVEDVEGTKGYGCEVNGDENGGETEVEKHGERVDDTSIEDPGNAFGFYLDRLAGGYAC